MIKCQADSAQQRPPASPADAPPGILQHSANLQSLWMQIASEHREVTEEQLARIERGMERVAIARGLMHCCMWDLCREFVPLAKELREHMASEVKHLSPVVSESNPDIARGVGERLAQQVDAWLAEHRRFRERLVRVRKIARNYRPPRDACPTFRALLAELHRFEGRLQRLWEVEEQQLFARLNRS